MNFKNIITKSIKLSVLILILVIFSKPNITFAATQGESLGIKYQSQIQDIGWQTTVYDNQLSGTVGRSLRLEGMKICLENPLPGMTVKYQTHVQNIGWQNWVNNGSLSGTQGQSLRLEGIRIVLDGAPAGYHVQYMVQVQNVGWQAMVQDGEVAGTVGRGLRLESIKIRIVKEGSSIYGGFGVKYQTHAENKGWQDYAYDGQMNGTQGEALRLEGIKIALQNTPKNMNIKYQTHVQNIGWQAPVYNDNMSGTNGRSLRLEGIKIMLEGDTTGYHVIYQVQIQNIGWQKWVGDGQVAGTTGLGYRLEAIRIRIVTDNEYLSIINHVPIYAIDIGHNAPYDGGAVAIRKENDLNKEVGEKVILKLMNMGYGVVNCAPTNPTSTRNSLEQRVQIANNAQADFFLSIHFNAGGGHGTETFASNNNSASMAKANRIMNNMAALGYTRRQIHTDSNYFVVKNTCMPSLLLECSFLDSQEDMNRYNSEDIANAIVDGLVNGN